MTTTPRTNVIYGDRAYAEQRVGHGAESLCRTLETELSAAAARIEKLEGALRALKGACQDVLIPAINEAIKGGFKMEIWMAEMMQFSKAVELTDFALNPEETKGGGSS